MAQPYVLPNRKAFADSIVRIFRKYRDKVIDPLDTADNEEDLCKRQGDMSKNSRDLLDHQKIVRDYLLAETPYRGLLLYHGLGSGKTCSAIGVAESLLTTRKVFILLPASLQQNFRGEIRKCGDPVYRFENFWEPKSIRTPEDREMAKGMGISDTYLDKNGRFYITIPNRPPNYTTLDKQTQTQIGEQIDDVLDQRFTFINYNGISKTNIDKILPPDQPHMFDNTTVIIDEAHNLTASIVNKSDIRRKIYDMIYNAKDCKVVALSGTPIINRPNEIAYLMNLLRGPIERITIPTKQAISWDEGLMTAFFRGLKDVDTIEYNAVKRQILLTRNPPHFESVYNEKNERIAVRYDKEFNQDPDIKAWVGSWKSKFEGEFGGIELESPEKFVVEELECLPTKFEDFVNTFIDGLNVKNPMLFGRRIQGLVSYFRTADERLLPKRIEEDTTLTKIPMSEEQFLRYLEERWIELQRDSRKGRMKTNLDEDYGSYRAGSRLVCNYALPPEIKVEVPEGTTEDDPVKLSNPVILAKIKASPDKYLSEVALQNFSPKMLQILKELKASVGEPGSFKNQFLYSNYRALQGVGIFAAILEANGFQEYKIIKQNGLWIEDPSLKQGVPAFAFYTGEEKEEEREFMRQIFNGPDSSGRYESGFPPTLADSIKEKKLCVLMATKSGAEGINLRNVRNVYIMESHWNPALIDQAIGRAIRICSHAGLPLEERTVKVKVYLTVFTDQQSNTQEGPNVVPIRRNDMVLKRYEGGEPREAFMTSDEFLWEVSYEKGRVIKNISNILKQSAVDCEIHRKLHAKNEPTLQCLRFDSTSTSEDLAFKPSYLVDDRDTLYMRNVQRKSRRLQKIKVKNIVLLIDPDTNQIFDFPAFEDSKRLIQLGLRTAPGEIRFFTSVVS